MNENTDAERKTKNDLDRKENVIEPKDLEELSDADLEQVAGGGDTGSGSTWKPG